MVSTTANLVSKSPSVDLPTEPQITQITHSENLPTISRPLNRRKRVKKGKDSKRTISEEKPCDPQVTIWRSSNVNHDDFVATVKSNCPITSLEFSNSEGKAVCEFSMWTYFDGSSYHCRAPDLVGEVELTPKVTVKSKNGEEEISTIPVKVEMPERKEIIPRVGGTLGDEDYVEGWGVGATEKDVEISKNDEKLMVKLIPVDGASSYVLTYTHTFYRNILWTKKTTEVPEPFEIMRYGPFLRPTLYVVVRNSKKAVIKKIIINLS